MGLNELGWMVGGVGAVWMEWVDVLDVWVSGGVGSDKRMQMEWVIFDWKDGGVGSMRSGVG